MRRRNSRSLAEFVQLQFWDFNFLSFKHDKDSKRIWKDSKSKETTQEWTFIEVFFGCIFLGVLRQSRLCKGVRRDESCNSGVWSNLDGFLWVLQRMEDVEDGRPGHFCSWENFPRYCLSQRLGVDRSIQRRFPPDPRESSVSQPELAAGWVGAFWPTLDEEPYQFPKKLHKSRVHRNKNHTNHANQTTQITSIQPIQP